MGKQKDKYFEDITKSVEYRGYVLHYIANLEVGLNTYLAFYFCGKDDKKMLDIQNFVFGDDRMSLGNKAQIFYHIASNNDKEWYNAYKSIKGNMNKDLVYAIEERNVFAHRVLDSNIFLPSENIPLAENSIRFVRFKNEVLPIDYNENKYQELCSIIMKLSNYIMKKLELIDKSTHPTSIDPGL